VALGVEIFLREKTRVCEFFCFQYILGAIKVRGRFRLT
jgi:hypothetical protein